jgi:AraC-like DNA-binding protein
MITKISIKNMVCRHCIEAALGVFRELDLEVVAIRLGAAEIKADPGLVDFDRLRKKLKERGFELIEEKDRQLVEQLKTAVIELIHYAAGMPEVKNSVFLAEKLGMSYPHLSKLFSHYEELTVEKYIILQKIERVKELLSYDEKSLSEIAFDLGYSSVQHLSNQFKSVTGMSVTDFKKLEVKPRKALSEIC